MKSHAEASLHSGETQAPTSDDPVSPQLSYAYHSHSSYRQTHQADLSPQISIQYPPMNDALSFPDQKIHHDGPSSGLSIPSRRSPHGGPSLNSPHTMKHNPPMLERGLTASVDAIAEAGILGDTADEVSIFDEEVIDELDGDKFEWCGLMALLVWLIDTMGGGTCCVEMFERCCVCCVCSDIWDWCLCHVGVDIDDESEMGEKGRSQENSFLEEKEAHLAQLYDQTENPNKIKHKRERRQRRKRTACCCCRRRRKPPHSPEPDVERNSSPSRQPSVTHQQGGNDNINRTETKENETHSGKRDSGRHGTQYGKRDYRRHSSQYENQACTVLPPSDVMKPTVYRRILLRRRLRNQVYRVWKWILAFTMGGRGVLWFIALLAGMSVVKVVATIRVIKFEWSLFGQLIGVSFGILFAMLCVRICIKLTFSICLNGRRAYFFLAAALDSALTILVWSILCAVYYFNRKPEREPELPIEPSISPTGFINDGTGTTFGLPLSHATLMIQPLPLDYPLAEWLSSFYVVLIVCAARAVLLDIIMIVAGLSFAMVLQKQAARLILFYEWLDALDVVWWRRKVRNVVDNGLTVLEKGAVSNRRESQRGSTVSAHQTLVNPQNNAATQFALSKHSTRVIRRMRLRQLKGGKVANNLALEYIKSREVEMMLYGRSYIVNSIQNADGLAREFFQEILEFQRQLDNLGFTQSLQVKWGGQGTSRSPMGSELIGVERKKRCGRSDRSEVQKQKITFDTAFNSGHGVKIKEQKLYPSTLALMLGPDYVEEFMNLVNLSSTGKVNGKEMVKLITTIYEERHSLVNISEAREGIALVFRVMVSTVLWMISVFLILIMAGLDIQTILISGAAALASLTVVLGVFYTNFFKAAIFVLLHDPYGVNDRVRVNGGPVMYVRHIHVYTTAFETVNGKPWIFPNAYLADANIVNDSRNLKACVDMKFMVAADTPNSTFKKLIQACERYVNLRPQEWVKNSLYMMLLDAQPGAAKTIEFWLDHAFSWHDWKTIYRSRSSFYEFIVEICRFLSIEFMLPPQPLKLLPSSHNHPPPLSQSPYSDPRPTDTHDSPQPSWSSQFDSLSRQQTTASQGGEVRNRFGRRETTS
eukprot:GHVN01083501.1.p1 GENE.GHVN01083501.1~~GHVN01083501.1.p1  ORF type:complete len:1101 (+),score=156.66 GHVN01083501.1:40-3342(+)